MLCNSFIEWTPWAWELHQKEMGQLSLISNMRCMNLKHMHIDLKVFPWGKNMYYIQNISIPLMIYQTTLNIKKNEIKIETMKWPFYVKEVVYLSLIISKGKYCFETKSHRTKFDRQISTSQWNADYITKDVQYRNDFVKLNLMSFQDM